MSGQPGASQIESISIIAPNAAGKDKKVGAGETAATISYR
jgi:hypothetical protein